MRSLLFVPGDSERKIAKALESGADALILDLEDSVASARKAEARAIVAHAVRSRAPGAPHLLVRINPLDSGLAEADLDAVMPAGPERIVLPKCVGGVDLQRLGAHLAVREAEHGLTDGATRILAIATETPAAIFALGTLPGASRRLDGLTWGGEDLASAIGAEANRDETGAYTEPYRVARALMLFAAAACGVAAIDSVFTDFRDLAGLEHEAKAARRDGFTAKMAIHPAQVATINAVFTPEPAAIARAEAIVAAFAANPDLGVIGMDGEMLDRPHLLQAERLLARANPLPRRG